MSLPLKCAQCSKPDPAMRCSRCRSVTYCSSECQKLDWGTHKRICVPERVTAIVIPCEGDKHKVTGLFQATKIGPTHDIRRLGDVCPVSEIVGLPLVIYRHLKEDPLNIPRNAALDNQIATYLMIDPESGFAPPKWQQGVGTVTVMRKDRKPLTKEAMETIWMYHDRLLDLFGDGPLEAYRIMNRIGFKRFCRDYTEERSWNNPPEF